MIKVTLIGKGNVSYHLNKAFQAANNVQVIDVLPSRKNGLEIALRDKKNRDSDVYIITVSDDAISAVSQQLTNIDSLVVHTAGGVPIEALSKQLKSGIFYPLQTFSKDRELDYKTIPICIEAKTEEDLKLLKKLANAISDTSYEIDSEKRKQLHLAAVFVNNFSNHLYHIGHELCEENNVPFEVLKPLIKETALKMDALLPKNAQTGPAKRGDQKTIAGHLEQLKNQNHKKLYRFLTDSIQHTYGKKL